MSRATLSLPILALGNLRNATHHHHATNLIQEGRIDEPTAVKHMTDAEILAASGVVLELRAELSAAAIG